MSDDFGFTETEPAAVAPEPEAVPVEPELLVRPVQPRVLLMEAARATPENLELLSNWIHENGGVANLQGDRLYLQTLDGPFTVRPGDDVIRGPQGFFRTDPELKLYDELRART